MPWKRKATGGFLAFVGFMLSPLSWWNDLFVNFPLAYAFAWIVSLFYRPAFGVSFVVGYWITNVLGFVLMQKGGQKMFSDQDKKYTRRELYKDLAISLLYTLLIIFLVRIHVIKPIQAYFSK